MLQAALKSHASGLAELPTHLAGHAKGFVPGHGDHHGFNFQTVGKRGDELDPFTLFECLFYLAGL